jgi:hypothetical protein
MTLLVAEDPALGRDVAVEAAVAIEMVGADVEEDGDVEADRQGEVELIGRQLQHVGPVRAQRFQRQGRGADVAADLRLEPGGLQDVPDQCRGGGLAVGAGDADEARFAAGAGQELDVADDLRAGLPGPADDRMRGRKGERDSGAQDERGGPGPVAGLQVHERHAPGPRPLAGLLDVVPGPQLGPARHQRPRRGEAGAAEPHHRDRLAGKLRHLDHRLT